MASYQTQKTMKNVDKHRQQLEFNIPDWVYVKLRPHHQLWLAASIPCSLPATMDHFKSLISVRSPDQRTTQKHTKENKAQLYWNVFLLEPVKQRKHSTPTGKFFLSHRYNAYQTTTKTSHNPQTPRLVLIYRPTSNTSKQPPPNNLTVTTPFI